MPMKRKISTFLFGLLFLIGFGILIYPTVSNQWNTYRQNQLISSYDNTIQDMESEDFTSEWEKAKAFNDTIQQNNLYGDVFGEDENDIKDTEYWKILNVADDGVMGYLSIPKINIKLAIYHGTGDKDLQTGVGHLNGTKLPIGGESTHSVLAAHRGLPSAKLFTDIDQLEVGDKFYIHVLDEVLAYKVDQIKVVLPEETQDIGIVEGKDYCTLVTCTPYAINTHRLLVRGERTEYIPPEELAEQNAVHEVQSQTITKRIVDVWPWLVVSLLIVAGVEGSIFLLIVKRQRSYGDVREKRKKGKRSSRSCNKTRRKK